MRETNQYARQLSDAQIEAGMHRDFIGGMWEEIGKLQFDFLRQQGLLPEHKLLDIGCGALRGGVHFVAYLEPGNYYGLDLNSSLLEAGRRELALAGLTHKSPHLAGSDSFALQKFGQTFDYLLAVSVFTHVLTNDILRCLRAVREVLAADGRFFASFFCAPHSAHLAPIIHEPGSVKTEYDRDPFHYSIDEMRMLAEDAGLSVRVIGQWNHPRAQQMLVFSR
jgi:cyclopropane fatty-acyl-phospholipid synthase-like methyltransferase